jgi:hypothetical protein
MSLELIPGNPAGRLLYFLQRADEATKSKNGELRQPVNFWRHVLVVAGEEESAVYIQYGRLVELIEQSQKAITTEKLPPHLYLGWVGTVRKVVAHSIGPGANIASQFQTIDQSVWSLLAVCDDQLTRMGAIPRISFSTMREMREEVSELSLRVEQSALDASLKKFLLKHLQIVDRAVAEAPFRGEEALVDGLAQSVGLARTEPKQAEEAVETPEGNAVFDFLGKYLIVVSSVASTLGLLEGGKSVIDWLLGGSGGE